VYRGAVIAVSIDGALVDPAHAVLSVFDRGLLYGDGCFEVLRTWGGAAVELPAHLDRLYETALFLALAAPDRDALAAAIGRTLAAAGPGEHRIRVVLTRGPGPLSARLAALSGGRSIVIVEPLPPPPHELSLAVVDWPLATRPGRGHKTLAYLDAVLARERARAAGADEALRLDASGRAVEGASCNVFAVMGGAVSTPPADRGALPGIVRQRVLDLCARAGIPTRVRALRVAELRRSRELFVTSSLRGVVPVTRIDGVSIPAGPVAARLAAEYIAAMRAL
jgi:branched-chain amino acid aminotransferase